MPGDFSMSKYDTQGNWVRYNKKNEPEGFVEIKKINGKKYVSQGDGKIDSQEFKSALFDYIFNNENNGTITTNMMDLSVELASMNLGDNFSIDNETDFTKLLEEKANELKMRLQQNVEDLEKQKEETDDTFESSDSKFGIQ